MAQAALTRASPEPEVARALVATAARERPWLLAQAQVQTHLYSILVECQLCAMCIWSFLQSLCSAYRLSPPVSVCIKVALNLLSGALSDTFSRE